MSGKNGNVWVSNTSKTLLLFFLVLELVADLPMIFPLRVFPCDVFAAWWAACCTGALALQRIPEAIASAR